ncbi:hypothetical protein CYLTODRAFT_488480 [Cylindrobasidium torrendii FP15055 ss-10]|uniref:DNA damage-binding protein 1 n=1 Tax=Cylindrobasidium torrendii FP15055 ss-10 TaxID=1314674 RepID=A0A0D7BHP5_9AGAR|nr:hypothetical protein CYLTODRAFT_488480 [Cylindrobasidium torrendii FP15055 ss-10]
MAAPEAWVVSYLRKPTAVLSSCRCRLGPDDTEYLVVLYSNWLEVYPIQATAVEPECSVEIWGRCLKVSAVPTEGDASRLVVLLDHPDPELVFLTYKPTNEEGPAALQVSDTVDLTDATLSAKPSEYLAGELLVDPNGAFLLVHNVTSRIKFVELNDGLPEEDSVVDMRLDAFYPMFRSILICCRMREANVLALALIPNAGEDDDHAPALAVLYTSAKSFYLIVHDINVDSKSLSDEPSAAFRPTKVDTDRLTDLFLFHVPEFGVHNVPGALLVVGGSSIDLFPLTEHKLKKKRETRKDKRKAGTRASITEAPEIKMYTPMASVQWPFGAVSSASPIEPGSGSPWLIADSIGRVALLHLHERPAFTLHLIGQTVTPATITYLGNQIVYFGSCVGDSKLLKIYHEPYEPWDPQVREGVRTITTSTFDQGPGEGPEQRFNPDEGQVIVSKEGSFLHPVKSYSSLAPINDAILADLDGSTQNQIIACSGGGSSGSMRIVRTGTSFQKSGSIGDAAGFERVFPIRLAYNQEEHKYLIVSKHDRTLVLHLSSRTTFERQDIGFVTDSPTLCAGNLKGTNNTNPARLEKDDTNWVVQITSKGVYLFDLVGDVYTKEDEWLPPNQRTIVAASMSPTQVLVALEGAGVYILKRAFGPSEKFTEVSANLRFVQEVKIGEQLSHGPKAGEYKAWWPNQISAVTINPLNYTLDDSSLIAVAWWHTNQVKIYNILNGVAFYSETPPLKALVRSLLFFNFGKPSNSAKDVNNNPHLVAGLADGTVVTYKLKKGRVIEKDYKLFHVGNGPVQLRETTVGDGTRRAILAVADRAVVFSYEGNRLVSSSLAMKDATASCQLNTAAYPKSVVLTTTTNLIIGSMENLTKVHVETIPFANAIPKRIVELPNVGFAVIFEIIGPTQRRYSLRILDLQFKTKAEWTADVNEVIQCMTPMVIAAQQRLVVGAYEEFPGQIVPPTGRIIVFDTVLNNISTKRVRGGTNVLAVVENRLVAAINESVYLYHVSDGAILEELNRLPNFYHISALAVKDHRLMVTDLFRSISVVQILDNAKLDRLAKDEFSLTPLGISATEGGQMLGMNDALNLFAYSLDTSELRPQLKRIGFYHVGEDITAMIRGSTNPSAATAVFKTGHVFFTPGGGLGVITEVNDQESVKMLQKLQAEMGMRIPSVGGTSHAKFRAPRMSWPGGTREASTGFLDGDFLSRMLPEIEDETELAQGVFEVGTLKERKGDIRRLLEDLQGAQV